MNEAPKIDEAGQDEISDEEFNAIIQELQNDLDSTRRQDIDRNFLLYVYPEMQKEAARIRRNMRKGAI